MSIVRVALDEKNSEAVAHLARQTGKTADQVVNEAVERFALGSDEDEQEKFARWRAALLGI